MAGELNVSRRSRRQCLPNDLQVFGTIGVEERFVQFDFVENWILDPSVAKNQAFTSWLESIPASATSGF